MEGLPQEIVSLVLAYATADYRDRVTLLSLRLVSCAICELVAVDSASSLRRTETKFFDLIAAAASVDQADGGRVVIRPVLAVGEDGHPLSVACYPMPDATRPGRHTLARFARSGGWCCIIRTDNLLTDDRGNAQPYMRFELHTTGVGDDGEPVPLLMRWSRMTGDDWGKACDPMTYTTGESSWLCTTSRGLELRVKSEHLIIEPGSQGGAEFDRLTFAEQYWITSRVTLSSIETLCSYISVAAYYRFDYETVGGPANPGDEARRDVIDELTSLCQSLGDDAYRSSGWYGAGTVYASPLELKHAAGLMKRVPMNTKTERA
jgi:hypothetical protein